MLALAAVILSHEGFEPGAYVESTVPRAWFLNLEKLSNGVSARSRQGWPSCGEHDEILDELAALQYRTEELRQPRRCSATEARRPALSTYAPTTPVRTTSQGSETIARGTVDSTYAPGSIPHARG